MAWIITWKVRCWVTDTHTHTHTHTQTKYCNPRCACALRVDYSEPILSVLGCQDCPLWKTPPTHSPMNGKDPIPAVVITVNPFSPCWVAMTFRCGKCTLQWMEGVPFSLWQKVSPCWAVGIPPRYIQPQQWRRHPVCIAKLSDVILLQYDALWINYFGILVSTTLPTW